MTKQEVLELLKINNAQLKRLMDERIIKPTGLDKSKGKPYVFDKAHIIDIKRSIDNGNLKDKLLQKHGNGERRTTAWLNAVNLENYNKLTEIKAESHLPISTQVNAIIYFLTKQQIKSMTEAFMIHVKAGNIKK